MSKARKPGSSAVPPGSRKKPFPQWRPAPDIPRDEDLLIVFHGLLSFSYRERAGVSDRLHCEVGVLNQDPKHKLKIRLEGGTCPGNYEYSHGEVLQVSDRIFRLEIVGSIPTADFYQVPNRDFDRLTAGPGFDNDFRWLIDVETQDLYDVEAPNKRKHYGPKLRVRNGTFFTQEKTASEFEFVERRPGTERVPLGSIAFCTAAKIKLTPTEKAKFTFVPPGAKDPIECFFSPKEPSKPPSKIFFTNLCYESNGKVCKDSDFHLHFNSFDAPPGKRLYDLVVVKPDSRTHDCGGLSAYHDVKETLLGTDEAPCHAMGYGQTQGGTP